MTDDPALNILLITADQWRGDLLGAAGHPFARTPNLDALARAGTRFAQHYCQAYPCGPARASLITGLHAHKHRSIRNGTPLDARHPTLFQEARRAGYAPRLFGYTDTTLDPRGLHERDPARGNYESAAPGIDVDTLLDERSTPWLAHLKRQGYRVDDPDAGREGIFGQAPFPAPAIFGPQDSETAFLTARFLDWLGVAGKTPWFAALSYVAPHPPFSAARPYQDLIEPADVPLPLRGTSPAVESAQHPLVRLLLDETHADQFAPGLSGPVRDLDDDRIRKLKAVYAGQAYEVDQHLGRVFAALKESGAWDRTLIVFTADHAEQLFDHWLAGKTAFYDQSAHIPLIVRDPREQADAGRGRVVEAFTGCTDILPTILGFAGLEAPRNCDGRDLLGFCAGEMPSGWPDEIHWAFDFRDVRTKRFETLLGLPSDWCNLQVVRTKTLKYVHFAGLPPVLFDLEQDPGEMVNRAAEPASTSLRIEGLERLLTWRQRSEDRALTGFLAHEGRWYEES